ncbi:hypothetical protein MUK42_05780 [Musa troglodytarum]|uniref:Uncharacterized protein n=1 Tax=Musa troglodytarum TaxID=320322 RepID=A0A9E7EPI6_9LILI|nr:hypothetical protein MUK42_05946 [Musa troglodytarum]URD80391.1 hypothetical protein MUK42_05946 [Musa troglodytarum]URD80646.1 hypothetical protein MUK42_05780 [Musa troglodytarum]URD80647.1 hypothetical protein MUK42_05780 [Musa troglodytarum]
MRREKLRMLKRVMRLVVSFLGPRDWLSLINFLGAISAKRFISLRWMSR